MRIPNNRRRIHSSRLSQPSPNEFRKSPDPYVLHTDFLASSMTAAKDNLVGNTPPETKDARTSLVNQQNRVKLAIAEAKRQAQRAKR